MKLHLGPLFMETAKYGFSTEHCFIMGCRVRGLEFRRAYGMGLHRRAYRGYGYAY